MQSHRYTMGTGKDFIIHLKLGPTFKIFLYINAIVPPLTDPPPPPFLWPYTFSCCIAAVIPAFKAWSKAVVFTADKVAFAVIVVVTVTLMNIVKKYQWWEQYKHGFCLLIKLILNNEIISSNELTFIFPAWVERFAATVPSCTLN